MPEEWTPMNLRQTPTHTNLILSFISLVSNHHLRKSLLKILNLGMASKAIVNDPARVGLTLICAEGMRCW
ncbi:hypothetical protein K7X08_000384 [Anisodus acutangulus]|uniref:Uncharacterized protein n=1 Tax=Anisodus acutangulus TaxID=402998 RepID=A0A9Q1M791_9SOLA|nr:hypothetical protein K7X08_000384 [Anisodus acutangulus]